VRKKYILLVLTLTIINLFIAINPVEGFYYNLISLKINKDSYFIDEDIRINASWQLNYNKENELAYIQIHITDDFEQIIWNSTKYDDIGTYKNNWSVSIYNLILDFNNSSFIFYVKFFLFYFHIENMYTIRTYLETLKISVFKRNVTCQLIGYKDRLRFGEILSFNALFFDESSDIPQNLNNLTVSFIILFNDLIIHQKNYTTNNLGVIYINLSSLTNLKLGQNILKFSIKKNPLFNNSIFKYNLFVEKGQLNIEIIKFDSNLEVDDALEVELYFYYFINETEVPLINHKLSAKIFNYNKTILIEEYKTDNQGILYLIISQELFFFSQYSHELTLSIYFNGTNSLENKTINLSFNIDQEPFSDLQYSFQMKFISFSSILIIIIILISFVIIKKRSKSEKLVSELVIKY
jgi:hypothetical protein